MKTIIFIGLGSFIGGVFRYLLTMFMQNKVPGYFPYGTLMVNVIGCLLIGMVYGASSRDLMTTDWRLFLATGVLGGFTTFSAFSYESISLLRTGHLLNAAVYISLSIILGLLATFTGLFLIKAS